MNFNVQNINSEYKFRMTLLSYFRATNELGEDITEAKLICRPLPHIRYSPFHKTLPIISLQIHWISVRFYEIGDRKKCNNNIKKNDKILKSVTLL